MFIKLKFIWSDFRLSFARMLAEGRWSRVTIPIVIVLVLTVVTAISLRIHYDYFHLGDSMVAYDGTYNPDNVFDAAYYLLFTNGGQNLYDGGHWLGLIITSLGIIFIAVLTSMITNAFDRIGDRYLSGESTYYMAGHIVIVGTSDVLYSILNSLKTKRKSRILILTSQDVAAKRREILSFLNDELYRRRIVFMYGDRTSPKDIARLSLAYAKEVFIIGDSEERDGEESYRDSYNMDCMEIVAKDPQVVKLRNHSNKLPCHVMFEYQTTFVAFQFSEMGDSYRENIEFMPFNFYDMWARNVLVAGGVGTDGKYKYLDTLPGGSYIHKDSQETVHLIIVGMSKMGVAFGLQAAHLCHFPNFTRDRTKRTRITFIDAEADTEFNYMNGRYRALFGLARHRLFNLSTGNDLECRWINEDSWLDVEWEFLKGRVESPEVQSYIEKACADRSHIVTLAICLARSHKSIATAMFLPASVFQNSLQVLVYQRLSGTIIDKVATPLNKENTYRYMKMRPFGMIDCGYYPQLEKELTDFSKYISYVYDSFYRTTDDGKQAMQWDEKLEDYDKSYGEYANYEAFWTSNKNVWEKLSSQFNAAMILTRLRSIGIDLSTDSMEEVIKRIQKEILVLQKVEHNRWSTEKLLTGFRVLTKEEFESIHRDWTLWHDPSATASVRRDAEKRWRDYRKELKGWPNKAHLDICSYDQLKLIEESDVLKHDAVLIRATPFILFREGNITANV